jgi:hypothetical protein
LMTHKISMSGPLYTQSRKKADDSRTKLRCSGDPTSHLYSLFPLLLYEETVVDSHQIGEFVFDLSGFSHSQIICLSVKKLLPCMQKDTAFLSHKSTSNSSSHLLLMHFSVRWHNIACILAHENQSLQASSSFTKRAPPSLVFSSCTQPYTQT